MPPVPLSVFPLSRKSDLNTPPSKWGGGGPEGVVLMAGFAMGVSLDLAAMGFVIVVVAGGVVVAGCVVVEVAVVGGVVVAGGGVVVVADAVAGTAVEIAAPGAFAAGGVAAAKGDAAPAVASAESAVFTLR